MSARDPIRRPPETAPRVWRFTLPSHPLSPNKAAAAGLRLRLRDKREWRDGVAYEARAAHCGAPLQRAHVTVTFIRPDTQWYDPDALGFLARHPVNGLVAGGLLVDDSSEHITLSLAQKHGPRRCVEITVEEVA